MGKNISYSLKCYLKYYRSGIDFESVLTTSISETEETEVVYGAENIINKTLQVFSNIKQRYDVCADSTGPYAFLKAHQNSRFQRLTLTLEVASESVPF